MDETCLVQHLRGWLPGSSTRTRARCSCRSKRDYLLGWNHDFLLSRRCSYTGSRGSPGKGPNRCAFSPARDCADNCARRCAAANLRGVALGVAFARQVVGAARNGDHFAVDRNRGQTQRELSGNMKPAAGFGQRYLAAYRRSRPSYGLTISGQVAGQGCIEGLTSPGRRRTDLRTHANCEPGASRNGLPGRNQSQDEKKRSRL